MGLFFLREAAGKAKVLSADRLKVRQPRWKSSGGKLSRQIRKRFDEEIVQRDALGVNLPIAIGGSGYRAMRKMSKKELIRHMDTLVIQPQHRADPDFYLKELIRREQALTNKILISLAALTVLPILVNAIVWLIRVLH